MKTWEPKNYRGAWYYDPRDELRARANYANQTNDSYLAVPIELAIACANLHECLATTISTGDEDGPMPELIIHCRKPSGHQHMHGNGYTNWI